MSIRFSRVNAMTQNSAAVFLVGGIPESQEKLEEWTAFHDFVSNLNENEMITVKVETFLYGEEEVFDATPEEVAYMYMRIDMRPDFIETRCQKVSESELFISLTKSKKVK